MRKIAIAICSLLVLFTLAACGGEGETQGKVEKRC